MRKFKLDEKTTLTIGKGIEMVPEMDKTWKRTDIRYFTPLYAKEDLTPEVIYGIVERILDGGEKQVTFMFSGAALGLLYESNFVEIKQ